MDHARGVDPPPAARFIAGKDIGAVFKHQPVGSDVSIDGWINGQREDQDYYCSGCPHATLDSLRGNPLFKAYLALAAVCFFWGTTYLGIRIALESFPPFTLVGTRYLLSGSILFAAAVFRGALLPS